MTVSKRRVIVVGSGGHCRTVISLLRDLDKQDIVIVDDSFDENQNNDVMTIPIVNNIDGLLGSLDVESSEFYLAIGDNQKRFSIYNILDSKGALLPNLISRKSIIHAQNLGQGNLFCDLSYIGPESEIGNNNIFNTGSIIEHECRIGSHCHFAPNSTICGRVKVGDYSFLGAASTVIPSLSMESHTTLGAGSTLIHNVTKSSVIMVGNPAREC